MNPALKIISEYIQMLNSGHVKEGVREATREEIEFSIALLQAIAADIEALLSEAPSRAPVRPTFSIALLQAIAADIEALP